MAAHVRSIVRSVRILAGDVGGTKTLLRCIEDDGTILAEGRYDSTAHATFDELLQELMARAPGPIDAACFAVAGPVYARRAEITNVGWVMEEEALARTFSIPRVSLVNDFYAIALGVPLLGPDDVLSLHAGQRDRSAPIGILGAGTGLGQAIVTFHGGTHHVIPSEGGHGDFAPQDEEQTRLFLDLHERHGHVSWERLLSGMGLVNIFTFLGGEELEPAAIADLADGGDARAEHAFEIFVDLYGAEAGNMALRVLARGGVYLAGGIAAKNVERFTDGRFVEAFLRKGRFRDLMATIPCDLIVNEEVGLIGATEAARRLG
jgi:glucokinase